MPQQRSTHRLRTEVAQHAARLIAVDGIKDYLLAKKKAVAQMGVAPGKNMPTNMEIEQALIEYQSLFQQNRQREHLRTLRGIAVNAMRAMRQFTPRLTGSVLTGTASLHADVNVHVFTDEPEQIGFRLDAMVIPYQLTSKSLRIGPQPAVDYPAYRFQAGQVTVNLIVFPENRKHSAPLSAVDGKPMDRADLRRVEALLQTD